MAGKYQRKDHLYHQAKAEGHRSRAFYKLEEIDRRFQIFRPGWRVLDLGAWPGGWLEYASSRVGSAGLVVGIDLAAIEDLQLVNVKTIVGDVRDQEMLGHAASLAGGGFDVVLSDLSPKLSGIPEVDRIAAVGLAETALGAATETLKLGGVLVIKVFKGNETEQFVRETRPMFGKISREELKATRKTSTEFYVIAENFKGGSH